MDHWEVEAMVLVGCVVVPSWPGVMCVDPPFSPGSAGEGALHLHTAGKQLGDWVRDQRADIILLVSHQVNTAGHATECPIVFVNPEVSRSQTRYPSQNCRSPKLDTITFSSCKNKENF